MIVLPAKLFLGILGTGAVSVGGVGIYYHVTSKTEENKSGTETGGQSTSSG